MGGARPWLPTGVTGQRCRTGNCDDNQRIEARLEEVWIPDERGRGGAFSRQGQ
jgi:hypothetical protein